jgi:hypothetical protein
MQQQQLVQVSRLLVPIRHGLRSKAAQDQICRPRESAGMSGEKCETFGQIAELPAFTASSPAWRLK